MAVQHLIDDEYSACMASREASYHVQSARGMAGMEWSPKSLQRLGLSVAAKREMQDAGVSQHPGLRGAGFSVFPVTSIWWRAGRSYGQTRYGALISPMYSLEPPHRHQHSNSARPGRTARLNGSSAKEEAIELAEYCDYQDADEHIRRFLGASTC
jgi:hypothetical protein